MRKLHSVRFLKSGLCPPRPPSKPEEGEFAVGSGPCVHLVSKRDLNSAALETTRISKKPTTVMTANGEVQTREEATVYVKELDLFVSVMLLQQTRAVLSLEKTLRGSWVYLPVVKNHISHQQKHINRLHYVELRTIRCPWSVEEFLYFIFICFFDIFIAGYCGQHGKPSNRKDLDYERGVTAKHFAWISRNQKHK